MSDKKKREGGKFPMNSSRGRTDQKQRFGIKNNDDKIMK